MNVLIIEFNILNQRMTRYTAGVIASNSYGYLKFRFNFRTDDWKHTSVKMANFSYKGRNYPVLIDANDMCTVPKEVIHVPSFCVSVFGGGITTNKINIPVEDSGVIPEEETSTQYYNEIINQLSAKIDELNETKADDVVFDMQARTLQLTANEVPIGSCCELPIDGHSCGIESFVINENEEIVVTLTTGEVVNLGAVDGASGVTFTPHIDEQGILTWTNNGGLENPEPYDLNQHNDWIDDDDEESSPDYVWEDE